MLVQQQGVQRVGQVVVMADDLGIAALAVQPALRSRLRNRRPQRALDDAETVRRHRGSSDGRRAKLRRQVTLPDRCPDAAESVREIAFDVQIPGDIGPGQSHLSGGPEQARQRIR